MTWVHLAVALAVWALAAGPAEARDGSPVVVESGGPGASALPLGPSQPDWMAAHFINVGQGSAALFEFSCGAIVIDTGGQRGAATDWIRAFSNYLDAFFARRTDLERTIDVVFITHPHPDHTSGIKTFLGQQGVRYRHVIVDGEESGAGIHDQRKLIRDANQRRIPQVKIKTSMIGSVLGLTSRYIDPLRCSGRDPDIRVLWGSNDQPNDWPAAERQDENNHSVAVRIAFGESSFLVTGDMEEPALRSMIERYRRNIGLLNTDVYVAGHHGSSNGTIDELVRVMSPELAVISAGDPSDEEPGFAAYGFGHPNRETIRLLSDPSQGVTMTRPAKQVAVGVRGRNPGTGAPPAYEHQNLTRAIFSTGWDGSIVVIANRDGRKRVVIE